MLSDISRPVIGNENYFHDYQKASNSLPEFDEEKGLLLPKIPSIYLTPPSPSSSTPRSTPIRKRNIRPVTVGKGETILVATPSSAFTPKHQRIFDAKGIRTHQPSCYIEVERLPDGRAKITLPESWRKLKGQYVIYEFVDEDGRRYIGCTKNFDSRIGSNYPGYFNSSGKPLHAHTLADAWKAGKRIFAAPLYVCSSGATAASAKQTETTLICSKKTTHKLGGGHNGNRGQGIPNGILGSPLLDGTKAFVPSDKTPSVYEKYPVIVDIRQHQPSKSVPISYDPGTSLFSIEMPEEFKGLTNAIYEFKLVPPKDISCGNSHPIRYVGQAKNLERRIAQHIATLNGGEGKFRAFAVGAREQIKEGWTLEFSVYGCTASSSLTKWETIVTLLNGALVEQGRGLNMRLPMAAPSTPEHVLTDPFGKVGAISRTPLTPIQLPPVSGLKGRTVLSHPKARRSLQF